MPTSVASHSAAYLAAQRQITLVRASRAAAAQHKAARLWAEVDGLGLSPEQFRAYAQMSAGVDARARGAQGRPRA